MIDPQEACLLAAGAALGDLEPDEAVAWDAHHRACESCQDLEIDLTLVLADLALVVPERIPPPDLLAAVRRSIAAPVATDAPVDLDAARTRLASGRSPLRLWGRESGRLQPAFIGLAAAFAIVAVGFGARSITLQQDLDRSGARAAVLEARLAGQGAVVAAAVDPTHVTVALHAEALAPAASATVMFIPGTKRAYVMADRLPPTPDGQGYQLWYADANGVHPLQTVAFNGDGAFLARMDVDLATATAVMITLEGAGGATGDPGPQVVFGAL